MLAVVLFVSYAAFSMNGERVHWVLWNATVGVHMESKDDSFHAATSIGVIRLGVGLGLEALALSNLSDDLVEQLRW